METIDKITHDHHTGQMQVAIVALANIHELLTSIYVKTYTVKYTQGSDSHLVSAMRNAGNEIYSADQVEAGAYDGAYIKSSFILIGILMYLIIVVGSLFSGIFLT